jgi:hypothetical protein
LFGQETLTKTLLQRKKPDNTQGLPVKKQVSTAVFISILLFSAVATAFFVKSTKANPYHPYDEFTEVPPPEGTQPPEIIIHTPQNGSFYPKNFNLTFDVIVPKTNGDKSLDAVTELYYKGSWEPKEIKITQFDWRGYQTIIGDTASFSIDLSHVGGGNRSITIYAVGVGSYIVDQYIKDNMRYLFWEKFKMSSFSTVSFIKDVVSPSISFLSPPNGTYVISDVHLDFAVSEAASEVLYCLDGKANQTVTGSLALTGLENGAHNVTLYAADLAGNVADPKTLFFIVDVPEPFPIVPVAAASIASVTFLCAGLLVYFKKRKRKST